MIVVGAGLAGLACTHAVQDAGLSVRVLEAASRVSGRLLTVTRGGQRLEMGGVEVGSSDARVVAIKWLGCNRARQSRPASDPASSGFGDGGYDVVRLAPTTASARCRSDGFANASGNDFMAGTWFGGDARSGEGLLVDALADGTLVVGFFTHRARP